MSLASAPEGHVVRPAAVGADPEPAIRTLGLTKRYAEVTAVDDLTLTVRRGEIYGFLGRNGAGKTTTIRMLLGLVRPTRGRVSIFGKDVARERVAAAAMVGSTVETATAYPNLTVRENLEIQRRSTGASRQAIDRAVAELGLEEVAHRRAGRLSLGNKQRLALARAVLTRPRLLVLDEPANGLDPAGIVEIRTLLRRMARQDGATVFVSSHMLGEVAQLVDRIGIIHRGRLVEEIDVAAGASTVRLELAVSELERATKVLATQLGIEARVAGDDRLVIDGGAAAAADVARLLVAEGIELHALCPVRDDLEARFLRLTGDAA
ncbi:MAG: ATP-binding cassette domain-containing protein [Deinococcales bacterium]